MKVIIFCGGKGTRLREETEFRPKPMVPIGGKPILWHIMKYYAQFGHKDFVLCLGYKGDMIKEYFRNFRWNTCDVTVSLGRARRLKFHGQHSEEDWSVTLAETGAESMTAYRLKLVQPYLGRAKTFLLTYGDGLATVDISACIEAHRSADKTCTISAVHPAGRFGSLKIKHCGGIKVFSEKPRFEAGYINGGFMVCSRKIFDYLTDDPTAMLEREPMTRLVADGEAHAYRHEGFWQPMDTYQEALYLNRLWDEGNAPWKIW